MSLIPKKSELLAPASAPERAFADAAHSGPQLANLPGVNDQGHGMRVLLIHSGHLGDTVMALSAMRRARLTFPKAEIAAIAIPPADGLLRGLGAFDHIWRLPRLSDARDLSPYLEWLALLPKVAAFAPHLAISFVPDPEGQIFLAMSAARVRVGAAKTHNWIYTRAWMTHPLLWDAISPSRYERYHAIADHAGLRDARPLGLADFHFADAHIAIAGDFVAQTRTPRVALLLCGSTADKRWPLSRYAELARRIHYFTESKPIVVTGPGEAAAARDVEEQIVTAGDGLHFRNQPLPTLAALLRECSLVITVDSGPGHMAAALGCETIYLMPRKKAVGYALPGRNVHVIHAANMNGINVGDVMRIVEPSLERETMRTA